ncbi:MAG: GNAT family N-acetyltransferase [Rhodospirillaceae bacterium]|nr:GNAT family N-acetyltransferase [Rhodospirillaceae bacterium]
MGYLEAQIRGAREEDAASVVAWFTTYAEAILWGGPAVPAGFDAKWLAGEITAAPDGYRTAYVPGVIVGICGLRRFAEERRLHIQRLGIAPLYRGKGLGRLLLKDAIAEAQKQSVPTVSLNVYGSNLRARRLYEEFGFCASKTRNAPEDVSGVSVYMERPVAL